MKKIILTIAAATTLLSGAVPAAAQTRGSGIGNQVQTLQQQVQRGVERRTISRNEAERLRARLRDLTQLERRYSRGGFSSAEQRSLQQNVRTLRQQIKVAEASRTRRR